MFKIAEKTELSQVSLTGMRAIVLLGLLIVRPRSLDEIRNAFIELNIMEDCSSSDILRIDLNTLKTMGCEISRSVRKTGYKYILTKHPFELRIEDFELNLLKKLYNRVKQSADMPLLIEYHELFNKISTFVFDTTTKENLLGISVLKYFEMSFLKDLMLDCKHKRALTLTYIKPTKKDEYVKEVVAQELVFKNDKVYLYAFDSEKGESTVLNVRRIKKILTRKFQKNEIETKTTKIKFHLKGFDIEMLEATEMVVATDNDGYMIEGIYYNDFIALQRILSLGSNCTVLEPIDFRNNVIEKLKEMRKTYEQ